MASSSSSVISRQEVIDALLEMPFTHVSRQYMIDRLRNYLSRQLEVLDTETKIRFVRETYHILMDAGIVNLGD